MDTQKIIAASEVENTLEMVRGRTSGEVCVVDWAHGLRSDWLHHTDLDAPLEDYHLDTELDFERALAAWHIMRRIKTAHKTTSQGKE